MAKANRNFFGAKPLLLALLAIATVVASLPLTLIAVDSLFGLGSMFVVPLLAVAVVFTITAGDRRRRAWWFAFAMVAGLCLQLCPSVAAGAFGAARFAQDLSKSGTVPLSQSVVELASGLAIVLTPPIAAILLGAYAGRTAQRWIKRDDSAEVADNRWRWRFSVRELAIGVAGAALLLALVANRTRSWSMGESGKQQQFLARFETSFAAGDVKLLAPPRISELQRTLMPESGYRSFLTPGVNEYRIVAPIEKNGERMWAIWAYTCNDEHDDMIYQFSYAEAPTEELLPQMPYPIKKYVTATWRMEGGAPK